MNDIREKISKKSSKFPKGIFLLLCIIFLYGFVVLHSASTHQLAFWSYKQLTIFFICLPITILIAFIDIKFIFNHCYFFYFFTLLLLIIVEISGKTSMGATRWINLGIIKIQPSELAKISIVLVLAKYLHKLNEDELNQFKHMLLPAILVFIPSLLIVKQPDLGTGIITILVSGIVFYSAGIKVKYFIRLTIFFIFLIPFIYLNLHEYQKNRIRIFLNPELEPLGSGYNIIQSKIAIGSGGFFGKGLFCGTQSHLSFLPEYQTDFIFSFLTEEFGFIGGIILLLLYSIMIIFNLIVSINAKSKFIKLFIIGINSIFFCHIFINIAMVMGLVPVVGVPLPLISYGGTMLVTMMICFGLIINAAINQHKNI